MGRKILFVDDEEMILKSLQRETREWMEELELEFTSAGSVDQGLEILAQDPDSYAVVVSDLKMPQKKGTVLLAEVNNLYPDIATILLTGFSEMEEIKACISSGIVSFIQKPWDADLLQAEILRALDLNTVKRERALYYRQLEKELYWAKEIHRGLFTPKIQNLNSWGVGLAYTSHASSSCGGDYFQIYDWKGSDLIVFLGDIAVKGVEGTYYALMIRDFVQSILYAWQDRAHLDPSALIGELNTRIVQYGFDLPSVLMTLSVGILQTETKHFLHANAGEQDFMFFRKGQGIMEHVPKPPIGYKENIQYASRAFALNDEDLVFLFSDGLGISHLDKNENYLELFCKNQDLSSLGPQEIADKGLAFVESRQEAGFIDDATLIVLRKI